MNRLLDMLSGGDRRSIGLSNHVASEVLRNPELLAVLIEGMLSPDPIVRMRAADAAEKASAKLPHLLAPHKRTLLRDVSKIPQQEVRWHLALMLPRLPLTARERKTAAAILRSYLDDSSRIVQVCAIQGLTDLARADTGLRAEVKELLERLGNTGSPAVKSRCSRLLKKLR